MEIGPGSGASARASSTRTWSRRAARSRSSTPARRRTGATSRAELAAMGRTLEDVRAVVLTHGHSDHIGFAERIRRERDTPILVHELDAALARGEVPNPAKGLGPIKIAPLLEFLVVFGDARGAAHPADQRGLDVRRRRDARRARVRHASSCCPAIRRAAPRSTFAGSDALFIGDAIATYGVTTGVDRPADRAVHRRPGAGAGLAGPARWPRGGVRPAGPRPGVDDVAWPRRWPRFAQQPARDGCGLPVSRYGAC